MKLVLKNSELVFEHKSYVEIEPTSELNTSTGFYVDYTGGSVMASAGTYAGLIYVSVYAVTAGTKYYIKSKPNWAPSASTAMTAPVGIAFGTNLLTGSGSIQNSTKIKSFYANNPETQPINEEFTPNVNGYIYITQVNQGAVCLSGVYI